MRKIKSNDANHENGLENNGPLTNGTDASGVISDADYDKLFANRQSTTNGGDGPEYLNYFEKKPTESSYTPDKINYPKPTPGNK